MGDAATKKTLKKQRSSSKSYFHRVYNRIDAIKDDRNKDDDITESFTDLEKSYVKLETSHEEYIAALDSDDDTDKPIIETINNDMATMYNEFCSIRSIAKSIERKRSEADRDSKAHITQSNKTSVKEGMKVKRLDPPKFEGGIRDYPSFRKEYLDRMVPIHDDDPFALKSCLRGEALKTVQGIDSDYDEMFKRLDLKYGRPEKLVDAVLNDLQKLKRINEGEESKFITMVETVERSWLSLKQMKMEREMDTTTMVSQIERLLPPTQKREWVLRKHRSSSSGDPQFPPFLEFLLEEKLALEYMQDELRQSQSSSRSQIHTAQIEDVIDGNNQKDESIESLKTQMAEVVQGLAQVTKAIASAAGNNNNNNNNNSNNNNGGRNQRNCWYHDRDDHNINDCNAFAALDVKAKTDAIRRNRACFRCLTTGHISRNCLEQNACEIQDTQGRRCGKYHHPLLHTSETIVGNSSHSRSEVPTRNPTLLMIGTVLCQGTVPITTLYDGGANLSLITHKCARKLDLPSVDVLLHVTKVGNVTEKFRSKKYTLTLKNELNQV